MPHIFAVCGWKHTGKTTLIEKLVLGLTARGYRVGTIKHHGHGFAPDRPGADSWRHLEAGAQAAAVVSEGCWQLVKKSQPPPLEELLAQFGDLDFVILEGFKSSAYPKIELLCGQVSKTPACDPAALIAAAADFPLRLAGIKVYNRDDVDGILQSVMRHFGEASDATAGSRLG